MLSGMRCGSGSCPGQDQELDFEPSGSQLRIFHDSLDLLQVPKGGNDAELGAAKYV